MMMQVNEKIFITVVPDVTFPTWLSHKRLRTQKKCGNRLKMFGMILVKVKRIGDGLQEMIFPSSCSMFDYFMKPKVRLQKWKESGRVRCCRRAFTLM